MRSATLTQTEQAIREALAGRRNVIVEVLAALQRMGRSAPPAVLVRPEDTLDSVRSAMLLGAVLPDLRTATDALAADLTEGAAARGRDHRGTTRLPKDVAGRARGRQLLDGAHGREPARPGGRGAKCQDGGPEGRRTRRPHANSEGADWRDGDGDPGASRAAEEARKASDRAEAEAGAGGHRRPRPANARPDRLAGFRDPARLTPNLAFGDTRGLLPRPVSGALVKGFNAPDGIGGTLKGVSIGTRPGAQVSAPTDGWVVYAGPFRSYGQLLIINAGDGYHVLLAGMDESMCNSASSCLPASRWP